MIPVKEAIAIARQELADQFDVKDVKMEEYALDRTRPYWLVTLSYAIDIEDLELSRSEYYELASAIAPRRWKTVSVNAETGIVDAVISGTAWELIK